MGRYSFLPQNVQKHASQLLNAKQISSPPPWYDILSTQPPSTRLTRPPLQRPQKSHKRASRLYKPVNLSYEEDALRWEFFNDHPWELARPRVMVESDGKDGVAQKWDWSLPLDYALERPQLTPVDSAKMSVPASERAEAVWDRNMLTQSGRPINGEAVVQRQAYLMRYEEKSVSAAYDMARREFYRYRHYREIESRVAHEEALATGAFFGLGPLEVGMGIEDRMYENWKSWAVSESKRLKQLQNSSGAGSIGDMGEGEEELSVEVDGEGMRDQWEGNMRRDGLEVKELVDATPGSSGGQQVRGSAPFFPAR